MAMIKDPIPGPVQQPPSTTKRNRWDSTVALRRPSLTGTEEALERVLHRQTSSEPRPRRWGQIHLGKRKYMRKPNIKTRSNPYIHGR